LRGADLSYVDFYRWQFCVEKDMPTDIAQAGFHGATVYLSSFRGGVTLAAADLRGAIIQDPPKDWPTMIDPVKAGVIFLKSAAAAAMFPGYTVAGMDMRRFNLSGADFRGIDLSGADMRNARIEGVDFRGANLNGVNLKGALYNGSTKWPKNFVVASSGAIFSGRANADSSQWAYDANSYRSSIEWLPKPHPWVPRMSGENWNESDFLAAWLPGASMSNSSFIHARFKAANLTDALARHSNFTGADFRDALLENADFFASRLNDADLRNASLVGAHLEEANLRGAVYNADTVWPAGFDPVAAGAIKMPLLSCAKCLR
jgi:uncharacterized protein YjbI with pentapeptide repeats